MFFVEYYKGKLLLKCLGSVVGMFLLSFIN